MKNENQLMNLSDSEREEIISNLSKNLPVLRTSAGATQEALAKYLGVTRQTIVNIENGKAKMNWPTAMTLIMFFSANAAASVFLGAAGILSKNLLKAIPVLGTFIASHTRKNKDV